MQPARYLVRRGQIQTYFDRTALDAWRRLTSDAPLGRIRSTVRAGRDRMRATLLEWLPDDLRGQRILDAGCGTGALAVALAQRGAQVLAIDLSPQLIALARERCPSDGGAGRIEFATGDFADPALGRFDHVVAMDSLIHYERADVVRVLEALAPRIGQSLLFTYAPLTGPLAVMHAVGRCFPRADRAPAIVPMQPQKLLHALRSQPALSLFAPRARARIASGFYVSEAVAWSRS